MVKLRVKKLKRTIIWNGVSRSSSFVTPNFMFSMLPLPHLTSLPLIMQHKKEKRLERDAKESTLVGKQRTEP
jgi:hypothetical protein